MRVTWGWGALHEVTEQKRVTEPLCAFSATARRAADVPDLLAHAFSIFASRRPRPVHISLPLDVQAESADEAWEPVSPPALPAPAPSQIADSDGSASTAGARFRTGWFSGADATHRDEHEAPP